DNDQAEKNRAQPTRPDDSRRCRDVSAAPPRSVTKQRFPAIAAGAPPSNVQTCSRHGCRYNFGARLAARLRKPAIKLVACCFIASTISVTRRAFNDFDFQLVRSLRRP